MVRTRRLSGAAVIPWATTLLSTVTHAVGRTPGADIGLRCLVGAGALSAR